MRGRGLVDFDVKNACYDCCDIPSNPFFDFSFLVSSAVGAC